MLRYLRENTGNWLIKFFLGIIVLVFVFLGIGSINSGPRDVVATVDEEPISIKEFQSAYKNMMEQMRRQFGDQLNEALLKALNLEQQVLDNLINQKLVEIQADKLGIIVSDKELSQFIMDIPAFRKNDSFDMKLYQDLLQANAMTPAEFENLQRNSIKSNKLMETIGDTVVVSDLEARQWYSYVNTRMAVDYLLVAPETFPLKNPSDKAIETFYKENEKDYQSIPRRKAAYLEFSPGEYVSNATVTEKQVEDFYHQNQARFNVPEKVEARHILIKTDENSDKAAEQAALETARQIYEKAIAGNDFAALAQKFSQGPSKDNEGYLGTFGRGEMVKPFEDAAFALEAGQISKPVKTNFGWHVIQVIAKHKPVTRTLAQAAQEIRQELVFQEAKGLAYDAAGKAFDAVIDGDDLEQVALIAKKEIQKTSAFDQTGKELKMPSSQAFAHKAFELSSDTISDVIQLGNRYYIIKITDVIDPVTLPLDQVKDRIIARLQAQEQKNMAKQTAEEILKKAASGTTLEEIAKEQNLTLASTELFSRREQVAPIGAGQDFTTAAFALGKEKPLCDMVMETEKGFVIIRFNTREEPSRQEVDSRLDAIKTQLTQLQKRQYYQEWLTSLRSRASITIEKRFFQ